MQGGPAVRQVLARTIVSPWTVETRVVADEQRDIESCLVDVIDRARCPLVITTGGTGVSPRDVTPAATQRVCERLLPGFGEAMRSLSMQYSNGALLSCQVAGTRGSSLIINLPGNPSAVHEILPAMMDPSIICVAALGGPRVVLEKEVQGRLRKEQIFRGRERKRIQREGRGGGKLEGNHDREEDEEKGEMKMFTVDQVNAQWLASFSSLFPSFSSSSASSSSSSLTQAALCAIGRAKAADPQVVFETVRGCGRKKVSIDLS